MAVEITAFFIGENMTVPVSDRLSQLYVGNGANTRFDFTFRVFQQEGETGIAVRQKGVTEFDTIDPSTYSVSINQDGMGGFITFITAPAIGSYFYIAGLTVLDQLLDITNYDNFYPDALERALDKLTALLQERSTEIDLEKQARILADIHYDALAMEREADLENRLISYINAMIGITNPAIFDGISDRMIITQDGRTQREFNESIPFWTSDYVNFKQETYLREEQILDHVAAEDEALDSKINNESSRAQVAEQGLQIQLNAVGVGNKAYKTYALMDADKVNIPAKSKVTVTNDATASNNGDWQWDGVAFTKSAYDPLKQAKTYTDEQFTEQFTEMGFIKTATHDLNSLTIEGYLNASTGVVVTDTNWKVSDFIAIKEGDLIELTAYSNSVSNANIVYYDSAKVLKSNAKALPLNSVGTYSGNAAQAGYVRFATRTASSTTFHAKITSTSSIVKNEDIDVAVASLGLTQAIANKNEFFFKSMAAITSSTTGYYVDNTGTLVTSSSRRYRRIYLNAGDTAFFKGFAIGHPTVMNAINGALFVTDANVATVIAPAPTTISSTAPAPDFWYEGQYTATAAGYLYLNLNIKSTQDADVDTTQFMLKKGVVGTDFFRAYTIDNTPQYDRAHMNIALLSMGSGILLTSDQYDEDEDNVLFLNGSKQTTQYMTSTTQGMLYVPVKKGDTVEYTGYFSANTNANLNYIIQCDVDKKPLSSLYTQPSSNTSTTVKVTASADGYIAIRCIKVLADVSYPYSVYYKSNAATVEATQAKTLMNIAEKLPIKLSMDHGYNSQTYTQNNIIDAGDYRYIVGVDENRNPFIMQRKIVGGEWKIFDLSTIAGNPFASPNAQDSHNNFVVCVTKDGYILVTGNHHNHGCRCVISNNPHDITAWTAIKYSTSTVAYPRIIRNGDTTLAFWRWGGSGDGTYRMAVFNDTTRTFNAETTIIGMAVDQTTNPYEQTIAIDKLGNIHLCWGYRTSGGSAVANFGMFYAKSADNGATWTNAAGTTTYAIPLTDQSSEKIYTVAVNEGYVNQNGGCYDLNNNYHTVFWHSDPVTGFSRIMHVWYDGSVWNSDVAHKLDRAYPPSSNMLPGYYSRPHVICGVSGNIFVVFKNTYEDENTIYAIDVTDTANHIKYEAIKFGTRQTELALNTQYAIEDNELVMMLAKGGGNVTNTIWQNQSAYLVTVPLPV